MTESNKPHKKFTVNLKNSHDNFFRATMALPEVAEAFFKCYLPDEIKRQIKFDSLKFEPSSFVDEELRLSMCDVVYTTDLEQGKGVLVILVEHQSTPDKLMPFRIMRYLIRIMDYFAKQDNACIDKPYPLIYPLVFYHGNSVYPYSTDMTDLINGPEDLVKACWLKPFQLIDLNEIEDKVLRQEAWSGVMSYLFKHIRAENFATHFPVIINYLETCFGRNSDNLLRIVISYIRSKADISKAEFFNFTNQFATKKELENEMASVYEQILAEGWQKGIEQGLEQGIEQGIEQGLEKGIIQGLQQGRQETIQQIARQMLTKRFSEKEIAQLTGLSLDSLKALKQQMQFIIET